MNTAASVLCASLACLSPLACQDREPVVSKDALSVHTVERGAMPLFAQAGGSLTSLQPPRAVVAFQEAAAAQCDPGRSARVQIQSGGAVPGKVIRALRQGSAPARCEIELTDPLPAGTAAGATVGALVEVGELKDVVFFARPAPSAAHTVATLFVLEPGSSHARRVTVHYGAISGPLIQVLDGLAPGDRVIVTDMSKWAKYPRVRLQ